ncbi:MAG: cysteine-rich CWC family protein [Proteobacteria bacterium]|nr:cysteine-rich CWC family protein [Pseudomonadota bacterium]
MPKSNSSQCPLCGQSNQCAMAAGLAPAQCWCMVWPIEQIALQRLASEQRGQACICPQCARRADPTGVSADMIKPHTFEDLPCPPITSK